MQSDAQYYTAHLMPVRTLWDVMRGGARGKFYRKLALSQCGYYWHDPQRQVVSLQAFAHWLADKRAQQLHLDTLELWDAPQCVRVRRELVLDMDLTDVARYCDCTGDACSLCWLHVEGAALLLRHRLCEQLDCDERHLLWVLSGRKGIHCVVNDPQLMLLDNEARIRLAQWLQRPTDWTQAAAQLEPVFAQQLLALFERRAVHHRRLLECERYRQHVVTQARLELPQLAQTSVEEWWPLLKRTPLALRLALQCYWPVVDEGPLRHAHLYKAPFSVHAATQRVALPVALDALQDDALPHSLTLQTLVAQHRRDGTLPDAFWDGCALLQAWAALYDDTC